MYDRALELADIHQTPVFLFSSERLDRAVAEFAAFTARLPFPSEVYYSYKTNYLPALCEHLSLRGFGAEVTSPLEWDLATSMLTPSEIVVNGIGKQAGLLDTVLAGGTPRLINLETDTEIEHLTARGPAAHVVPVGLRVTIPEISGEAGRDPSLHRRRGVSKFGWSADGTPIIRAARRLAEHPAVRLGALHIHLGGQLVSAAVYRTAMLSICRLLERLRAAGVSIGSLDMGGGLASGWVDKRRVGPLFELLRVMGLPVRGRPQRAPDLDGIAEEFVRFAPRLRSLGIRQLLFEPGRFLAEPSLMAVASVIAVRHDGHRRHAVLDLGTNALHCWRPDETRPIYFESATGPAAASTRYELVGPLCHRSDTYGAITTPTPLQPGMKVCLDAVGAYSIGDWIANTWQRPPVVSLEDGTLLWDRQSSKQFWSLTSSPMGKPS
ncbi:hypothetical protein SMC26_23925 [Actinomadura fulvescens]|uniref:diaminopimelate decarboxylase family protein n=1 Tax=Actinomadura fulvescens TaxID=46160 RepID=UPI0031DF9891